MKNNNYKTVKAIVIPSSEFTKLAVKLYGKEVKLDYALDGLWVGCSDGECDIEDKLSEYFELKVTEIHLNNDGCFSEVWIAYEE